MIKEVIDQMQEDIKSLNIYKQKDKSYNRWLRFVYLFIIGFVVYLCFQMNLEYKEKLAYGLKQSQFEKQLLISALGQGGVLKNDFNQRDIAKRVLYLMENYNLTMAEKTFNFLNYPFENPKEAYLINYESQFVYRKIDKYFHTGIDCSSFSDYNVRSIYFGRVVKIKRNDFIYGNMITIEQNIEGYLYRISYAHLFSIRVKKDEFIKKGQIIGIVGMQGYKSTGYHLHLEIKRKEKGKWIYYNFFSNNMYKGKYYLSYP